MPRRLTEARKRRQELTEEQIDHLLSGWCLESGFPFENEAERRQKWSQNRAYLMSFVGKDEAPGFYSQHGLKLGTRPAGWWSYEAKAPRRRIRNTAKAKAIGTKMHLGIPALWTEYIDTAAEFETEVKYLRRHGLGTAEEVAKV